MLSARLRVKELKAASRRRGRGSRQDTLPRRRKQVARAVDRQNSPMGLPLDADVPANYISASVSLKLYQVSALRIAYRPIAYCY